MRLPPIAVEEQSCSFSDRKDSTMHGQAVVSDTREGRRLPAGGEDPTDVYCWRLEQLIAAGYSAAVADVLATHTDIDLHLACNLVSLGCSERLAYSILL
jgi:hypothetical protein